jgi:thiol-disulfide isomerase/thioredoxin
MPNNSTFRITPNLLVKRSDKKWIIQHPFAQTGTSLFAITADWCGHCKRLHSAIKETQSKYDNKFKFFYLDASNNDDPAVKKVLEAMQVNSFPTLYRLQHGVLTPYKGSREPFELYKNFSKQF